MTVSEVNLCHISFYSVLYIGLVNSYMLKVFFVDTTVVSVSTFLFWITILMPALSLGPRAISQHVVLIV